MKHIRGQELAEPVCLVKDRIPESEGQTCLVISDNAGQHQLGETHAQCRLNLFGCLGLQKLHKELYDAIALDQ